MPIQSQSIIVGGGVELLAPATIGNIALISSLGPPGTISDSIARQWTDGAVNVITVGAVNVRPGVGVTETFRLRGGLISEGGANDTFIAGRGASVGGVANAGSIAIGWDALCSGPQAIAIGGGGSFADDFGVAIGYAAFADDRGVALGFNAFGDGDGVTIGASTLGVDGGIVIGFSSEIFDRDDLAIGNVVILQGTNGAIAIGHRAAVTLDFGGVDCLVIGNDASIGALGQNTLVAIGIGNRTIAEGGDIVIGHGAQSQTPGSGNQNIIVGHESTTTGVGNILLGHNIQTTLSNTAFIGSMDTEITTLIIGAGDVLAASGVRTVRFTNGSGVNDAAGEIIIQAALSTGNAVAPGFTFRLGAGGASGAVLQTANDKFQIFHSTNAGETSIAIYDVDTDVMNPVLVGAAGTGPGGVGRALYLA